MTFPIFLKIVIPDHANHCKHKKIEIKNKFIQANVVYLLWEKKEKEELILFRKKEKYSFINRQQFI